MILKKSLNFVRYLKYKIFYYVIKKTVIRGNLNNYTFSVCCNYVVMHFNRTTSDSDRTDQKRERIIVTLTPI